MKSKKVILDTNLWISFLITRRHPTLDDYLFNGKIKLVFSKELIEEFLTVAKRPKNLKNTSLIVIFMIYFNYLIVSAN
jgi:uncharacterized protein